MSGCREIQVTIPATNRERQAAQAELAAELAKLPAEGFAEIWVDHDPVPRVCALVNGGVGWLMWMRYEGDAGCSSRNRAYLGPADATVAYMLSNGQVDNYPASWAYPRAQVFAALESFARDQGMPGVSWFDDNTNQPYRPEAAKE